MASNEHGAMEQNGENHEANISIYYTHETELYAESYDAMNRATYFKNISGLREFRGGEATSIWIWRSPELRKEEGDGGRRGEEGQARGPKEGRVDRKR